MIERFVMLGKPRVGDAVWVPFARAIYDGNLPATLQKSGDLVLDFKSFTVFLVEGLLSWIALHFPSSPNEPAGNVESGYCSPETAR